MKTAGAAADHRVHAIFRKLRRGWQPQRLERIVRSRLGEYALLKMIEFRDQYVGGSTAMYVALCASMRCIVIIPY